MAEERSETLNGAEASPTGLVPVKACELQRRQRLPLGPLTTGLVPDTTAAQSHEFLWQEILCPNVARILNVLLDFRH
jgi:hypothetical protein